jgi:hypothetical protein
MKWFPKFRKMTWVLIIFSTILFAWMIGAGVSAGNSVASDCAKDPSVTSGVLTKQECIDASNAGTGIGIGLLFFLWFMGFVVLGIIWFMTRPRRRDCPVCGEGVKRGATVCKSCGHDFARALVTST